MEMKGLLKLVLVVVMGMVLMSVCRGDVDSFRDCYAKCFIFCMIEPNQTLCTCTTQCLKECIFPSLPGTMAAIDHPHTQNLGYCKLGCATSLCSNISKAHNPDGKNVESCVGSCTNKCTMSYTSSSP
ncbi:putative thionin-like protein [Helianthus annuus]|nr:putative thionin-like protein [Helianthus annuus]